MTIIDRSACRAQRHGTVTAYKKHRCRCDDARAAEREFERRYRRLPPKGDPHLPRYRHVDEVVVQRAVSGERLAMGYEERRLAVVVLTKRGKSAFDIAEQLGCTPRTVQRLRSRTRELQAA